jgi:hypothetical protein
VQVTASEAGQTAFHSAFFGASEHRVSVASGHQNVNGHASANAGASGSGSGGVSALSSSSPSSPSVAGHSLSQSNSRASLHSTTSAALRPSSSQSSLPSSALPSSALSSSSSSSSSSHRHGLDDLFALCAHRHAEVALQAALLLRNMCHHAPAKVCACVLLALPPYFLNQVINHACVFV